MKKIDLHIHTTASDGKLSPTEVVDLAIKKGMKSIAITDHDTISGLKEVVDYSEGKDIEIVKGIEIACREKGFHSTIDVLGLFINPKSECINSLIKELEDARKEEKIEIIKRLNILGFDITFGELLSSVKGSIGRPHIAKILIKKYREKFSSINDVFDKLIGEGKPAFVRRKKPSIERALEVIRYAGGIPILAHPGRYTNEMSEIIDRFVEAGGKGIETDYPYDKIMGIDNGVNDILREIANEKNLLVSGGSDFHDPERKSEIGDAGVTEEEFDILKSSLSN